MYQTEIQDESPERMKEWLAPAGGIVVLAGSVETASILGLPGWLLPYGPGWFGGVCAGTLVALGEWHGAAQFYSGCGILRPGSSPKYGFSGFPDRVGLIVGDLRRIFDPGHGYKGSAMVPPAASPPHGS